MLAQAVLVLTVSDFKFDQDCQTTSQFSLLDLTFAIVALLAGLDMTVSATQ